MTHHPNGPPEPQRLSDVVTAVGYAERVMALLERVRHMTDPAAQQAMFVECITALGAWHAIFFSVLRHPSGTASARIMLACDPAWGRRVLSSQGHEQDSWLTHAQRCSEPLVTSWLGDGGKVTEPGASGDRRDFASVLLAPAHANAGSPRTSVLCLGSPVPGYFEDRAVDRVRLGARVLAAELHDWWQARTRQEVVATARLTPTDLDLLRHQHRGHGSKQIARDLHVSVSSVNSRFQRMNARLGIASRRSAAQWAAVLGLIEG